jgi:predicted SAM-dependent methyltransferase
MAVSENLKRRVKIALRPLALPLIRRMNLPFDMMLPRIEAIESQLDERIAGFEKRLGGETATANRLSGAVENLSRAWLQMQNQISTLAAAVAAQTARQAAFENQLPAVTTSARDAAVASLRGELDGLAAWLTNTDRYLHDDITGRGNRVDNTLHFLLERVEFVRREMLFELRYGEQGGSGILPKQKQARPRIVSVEKIAAAKMGSTLRLNLGCGHIPLPDFINIDMRDLPGVDVIAECGMLPFEPGSVDEIFSAHLVEHFPQEEFLRRLLPYWRDLLSPGGMLRTITPDGAAMLAGIADGSYGFEDFRDVVFGGQDYDGDFHYNLFTPETLARTFEQAGFVRLETPVRGRRNGQCFEFELVARAPTADDVAQRGM